MNDADRWDEKYRDGYGRSISVPDSFVLAALESTQMPREGRALDLAAGNGRHAVELARRGWTTEAWDVSPVGLAHLDEAASEAGVEVKTRVIDLTSCRSSLHGAFDLVVLVNYLDRELLPHLASLLAPPGFLIFITYTTDRSGSRPSDRHCLKPGELAKGLPGLVTELYEESEGRAGLIASPARAITAPR